VAASLACLKELGKPSTYESLKGYGTKLKSGMAELFVKYGLDAQIAGVGSITDYFFMKEEISDYRSVMKSNLQLKRELARQLMLRNILPGGRWANSTCHGEKELQMTLSAMDDALKALRVVGKLK
jgi:glutamate-1-semialdehyde aminotransferase